jgi:acetyltransferase
MHESLTKIFHPKTVAVIGASSQPHTVGYALMKNLIGSGYEGIVYPVNPKHKSIQGVRSYASITEVPDKVDLAVISTPAHTVKGIVEACGEAGVGGLLIISAGFKEVGADGEKLAEEIRAIARSYGMRFLGPNCLGFINPSLKLNASFANRMASEGRIAFISQSGALCTAILDWAHEQNVGFSHFVSIGSMVDVGFADLIDYFGNDPHTSCILIYMESLTEARRFMSAARAFSRTKPIIVLKAGRSPEGSKVALSHTGTLAGNDDAFKAAFKRAGIIQVETIEQLFDTAQALAMQKRPRGKRLAIVTNAGGAGVLATDHLVRRGGKLAQFSQLTFSKLNEILPPAWSHGDPVDVLGDASPERFREAVRLCLKDPDVDGLLAILVPQAISDPTDVAREIVPLASKTDKTILATWMGEEEVSEARDILEEGRIPTYRFPESAVDAFLNMYQYSENNKLLYETPATIPHEFSPDNEKARQILQEVIQEGRLTLTEIEAKKLLATHQIATMVNRLATTAEEAVSYAEVVGLPLAMKIVSPDIQHKTDVGGVFLGVRSAERAGQVFTQIIENAKKHRPEAQIDGVLLEPMIDKDHELLIGCKKDPIFGPVIVFGMGGVAVELFKDINMGFPPLNMALAKRIIEETKVYELLKGYRGMPGVDINAIQFLLYKFAYLVMDFPEIKEIDINPFVVDEHGGLVLDAKVVLDEAVIQKPVKPYSHLIISPYPKEYITSFTMKNGQHVLLRPIRPEDEPMEAELFTNLSEETKYFRFFGFVPNVTHDLLARFTQIDYDREIAIIAEVEEKGEKKMAGVVRLVSDPVTETAEFAIVVADPWQGNGLGNYLTDYGLKLAREKGIKTILASFLNANTRMRHMFEARGFTVTKNDFESSSAELKLEKVEV